MCPVKMEEVRICEEECEPMPLIKCDETVDEVCTLLVDEQRLENQYALEDNDVNMKIELYKELTCRSELLESL